MNDPDFQDEIGAAIRASAATVQAPQGLRHRVAARRSQRSRTARLAALATAVAVAATTFLLLGGGGPSVQQVAVAALDAPTSPAPAVDPRDPGLMDVRVGGLAFPNYEPRWGWQAVGVRTDEVAGRRAVTVVYRKGTGGVHYTIVEGEPLTPPDGARRMQRDGKSFAAVREDGAQVLSWELEGQTCVLASRTVGTAGLLRMASWR